MPRHPSLQSTENQEATATGWNREASRAAMSAYTGVQACGPTGS